MVLLSSLLSGNIGDTLWGPSRNVPLESRYKLSHRLDDLGVFAVAFVASTPSWIPADLNKQNKYKESPFAQMDFHFLLRKSVLKSDRYRNTRCKSIWNACSSNFKCSCSSNPFNKIGIPGWITRMLTHVGFTKLSLKRTISSTELHPLAL